MIILNRDGSLEWEAVEGYTAAATTGTIELSADLVARQSDLLDRLFAFAFDVLGLVTVELRIRTTKPISPESDHAQ
jgi:hypothetical protein